MDKDRATARVYSLFDKLTPRLTLDYENRTVWQKLALPFLAIWFGVVFIIVSGFAVVTGQGRRLFGGPDLPGGGK